MDKELFDENVIVLLYYIVLLCNKLLTLKGRFNYQCYRILVILNVCFFGDCMKFFF